MKTAKVKRNQQQMDAHYMKLNRQRASAAYNRFIAQQEGNEEAYHELDKLWHDLNEEMIQLEKEGARV